MKLNDYAGSYTVSADDVTTYIKTWFHPKDLISITVIGTADGAERRPRNYQGMAQDYVEMFDGRPEEVEDMIFGTGAKNNVYINLAAYNKELPPTKRGTEDDVEYIPGMYADLDMKDGCFSSLGEIYTFLTGLEVQPTMVVASGSGGVHAYWKFSERVANDDAKDLMVRWWSYLQEAAGDRKIDKLIDITRMLRLPGTVYFPKAGSEALIGSVRLLQTTEQSVSVERILSLTAGAWERKQIARQQTRARESETRRAGERIAVDLMTEGNPNWNTYMALSQMEDYVNDHITWDEILLPHGWTMLGERRDDRQWARPGRNERSATTDFLGSPVMSLFSESEETGLADLREAMVTLTKFRVMLRLHYQDNVEAMLRDRIAEILGTCTQA